MKTRFLWLCAAFLTQPVQAQLAPIVYPQASQGVFTGISVGVQLGSTLRIRTPGTTTGSTVPWTTTTFGATSAQHPSYANDALFSRWTPYINGSTGVPPYSSSLPLHNPVFGDMSTGADLTPPVDLSGTLNMIAGSDTAWYSLSFTVNSGTTGVANSVFSQLGGAAGHVYSYTVPLSTGIRLELVNTLRYEYTRSQMGLAGTPTEITALDWGMGIISTSASGSPGTMQPVRNRLYFTLDRAWWITHGSTDPVSGQGRVNKTVSVPGSLSFQLDPSVVYRTVWENGQWSIPVVAFDQMDLYGSAQVVGSSSGPAIDALSVDQVDLGITNWRVVFSLDAPSKISNVDPPAEILVSQKGETSTSIPTVTAKALSVREAPNGPAVPIDNKIGIGPDEITGLCGRDPRENRLLDQMVGTPVPVAGEALGLKMPMGLSLQRFEAPPPAAQQGGFVDTTLFEVHGIQIPANRIGVLAFEGELMKNNPLLPMTLPIVFTPALLPGTYVVLPGTETFSLALPTTAHPGKDVRLRAILYLVGDPSSAVQKSWVSSYSM